MLAWYLEHLNATRYLVVRKPAISRQSWIAPGIQGVTWYDGKNLQAGSPG